MKHTTYSNTTNGKEELEQTRRERKIKDLNRKEKRHEKKTTTEEENQPKTDPRNEQNQVRLKAKANQR